MTEPYLLSVASLAGGPICVASEDGQRVYREIAARLEKKERVILSFAGVDRLTTAFLNAAIGQLYNEFTEDVIRRLLMVSDLDAVSSDLLRRVVVRAKEFFKDPARINFARKNILIEDDDAES